MLIRWVCVTIFDHICTGPHAIAPGKHRAISREHSDCKSWNVNIIRTVYIHVYLQWKECCISKVVTKKTKSYMVSILYWCTWNGFMLLWLFWNNVSFVVICPTLLYFITAILHHPFAVFVISRRELNHFVTITFDVYSQIYAEYRSTCFAARRIIIISLKSSWCIPWCKIIHMIIWFQLLRANESASLFLDYGTESHNEYFCLTKHY